MKVVVGIVLGSIVGFLLSLLSSEAKLTVAIPFWAVVGGIWGAASSRKSS